MTKRLGSADQENYLLAARERPETEFVGLKTVLQPQRRYGFLNSVWRSSVEM